MLSHLIEHQTLASMAGQCPDGKVFQIFGFDILLDRDLKAWILEINDHPSLNIMYTKEFMWAKKEDETLSYVDLHVKKTVMVDALKLVLKSPKKLSEID